MRLKTWLTDLWEWHRPERPRARLRHDMRCFPELGAWPRVYRSPAGFHLVAPHESPDAPVRTLIGWGCIGAAAAAAAWTWYALHPVAGAALAVILAPVLLLSGLGETPLEIVVTTDGRLLRRRMGGRFTTLMQDFTVVHRLVGRPHRDAPATDQVADGAGEVISDLMGQGAARHRRPPPLRRPGARPAAYSGASELVLRTGPDTATPLVIAEFGRDPGCEDALRLAAAINFVMKQVVDERVKQGREGRDRSR